MCSDVGRPAGSGTTGVNPSNGALNPTGSKDAVRAFYELTIVQTGANRLEFDCDRVIVDSDAVFTEGVLRMAYPGRTLTAMGIEVDDPDGYYLSQARMGRRPQDRSRRHRAARNLSLAGSRGTTHHARITGVSG